MTKGLTEKRIYRDYNVEVRTQPGCTTLDMEDQIKPVPRKKPYVKIIHSGTNYINNGKLMKKTISSSVD